MDDHFSESNLDQDFVVKTKEASKVVGLHPQTMRRLEAVGEFPKRIVLSPRQYGYVYGELIVWRESRRAQ